MNVNDNEVKSDIEIVVESGELYINLEIKHKSNLNSTINPLDIKNKIINYIKREFGENNVNYKDRI